MREAAPLAGTKNPIWVLAAADLHSDCMSSESRTIPSPTVAGRTTGAGSTPLARSETWRSASSLEIPRLDKVE